MNAMIVNEFRVSRRDRRTAAVRIGLTLYALFGVAFLLIALGLGVAISTVSRSSHSTREVRTRV